MGACKVYATPTEAALIALTGWAAVGLAWQLAMAVLNAVSRIQEARFASELRKGQAALAAFTRARRLAEEQDLELAELAEGGAARGAADGAGEDAAA
jgi:hypothetical protein